MSKFPLSCRLIALVLAVAATTGIAIRANASPGKFAFIDNVKDFFGIATTQDRALATQTPERNTVPKPEPFAGKTLTWLSTSSNAWETGGNLFDAVATSTAAPSAYSLVSSFTTCTGSTLVSNITTDGYPFGSGAAKNNLIVMVVSNTGAATRSVSAPTGMITILNDTTVDSRPSQSMFYKVAAAGDGDGPSGIQIHLSAPTRVCYSFYEYSGTSYSSPLHGFANASDLFGQTHVTGTATPFTGGDLLVAGFFNTNNVSWTSSYSSPTNFFVEQNEATGGGAGVFTAGAFSDCTVANCTTPSTSLQHGNGPGQGWRGQIAAFHPKTTAATTSTGSNQTVTAGNGSVTFDNVTASGTTTVNSIDPTSPSQGAAPSGITYNSSSPSYDISTTATFTGSISVCISIPDIPTAQYSTLRLLHKEGGVLVDRTTSVDTGTKKICGTTTSLSPFIVANGPTATAPTVTASAASSITSTTATMNGNVTSDGGATVTERGFYWKSGTGVTTGNGTKLIVSGTTGAYTSNLSSLSPHTTYSYIAYATNSVGTTVSSPETQFTTLNTAPTVSMNLTSPQTVSENSALTIIVTAADADGDTVTFDALAGTVASLMPDAPSYASSGANQRTFSWTPGFNRAPGPYTATFGVSDGNGGTASATMTINVTNTNQAPTAQNVTTSTAFNTPVQITMTGTDADQQALTFNTSSVSNGTLGNFGTVSCSGTTCTQTVDFTPITGYSGAAGFSYTATDGIATSSAASVSITVNADATQASDCFRSLTTGNWGTAATWQSSHDCSGAFANPITATLSPDFNANTITIRNGHTVTIAASITYDQVTVDVGGQVTVAATITSTLANGSGTDLIVNGTWLNSGGTWTTTGTWQVNAGGTYIHNTTSGISTPLGAATLDAASNFIYRGNSALNTSVSTSGRTYGNLSFESTSGTWAIAPSGGGTLTVNGNFVIGSGVSITTAQTGVMSFAGNFTNNGILANGAGTQIYTFTGGGKTISGSGAIGFETWNVNSGASITLGSNVDIASTFTGTINGTLNTGTNAVTGAGAFTLGATGILNLGSVDGLSTTASTGNIQVNGTRTYTAGSNFGYNGTSAQVTGNGLPITVSILTISNSSGVTLSQGVTATTLTLGTGNVTTLGNTLAIASGGTVSRTSGHVIGNLHKTYTAAGLKTYEVGTTNGYSPVSIDISATGFPVNSSFPIGLMVSATQTAHPLLTGANKLARYWTLTKTQGAIGNSNLTFTYLPGDITGNVAAYQFMVSGGTVFRANPSSTPTTTSATLNLVNLNGALGDWGLGEDSSLQADHLVFQNVPTSGLINSSLSSFKVRAIRADGTIDPNYTSNVSISKATGPGTLSGTSTKAATAGEATFDDIKFDQGGSYTLNANSGSLPQITSGSITINVPTIVVDGGIGSFDFPNTAVGQPSGSRQRNVTGTNLKGDITCTASAEFEVSKSFGVWSQTVTYTPSGGNVSSFIDFRFHPTSRGAKTGNLACSSTDAQTQTFPLTGTGVAMTLSPSPVLFGTHSVGSSTPQTVTITNHDSTAFTLNTPFTISGGDTGDFSVGSPGTTTVAAGTSTTVDAVFTPTSNGSKSSSLVITNSFGESATAGLIGSGVLATATVSNGNILISDSFNDNTADNLTLTLNGANVRITDPNNSVFAGDGCTAVNSNTIDCPFTSTGSITVNTLGGNDTLTVNLANGDVVPNGGISYNGGTPTTGPGDKLNITGGAQGTVTYNYTDANSGNIVMSNFGTISYTGLEPISNTGSADDVIINLPNAANNAGLVAAGVGQSTLQSGMPVTFENTTFSNPTGSIRINPGSAADIISTGTLPAGYPSLQLGASDDLFASVSFNGAIPFAAEKNLIAYASGPIGTTTSADLTTSGNGAIFLQAGTSISIAGAGIGNAASLVTENGPIDLFANDGVAKTPGNYRGITVGFGALVEATGTGKVRFRGTGGDSGGGGQFGIFIEGGTVKGGTTAGVELTDVMGNGGATSGNSDHGVVVSPFGSISSNGGNVSVEGRGGAGGGERNYGVITFGLGNPGGGMITSGGNGTVEIEGFGGGGTDFNIAIVADQGGIMSSGGTGSLDVRGIGGTGNNAHGVLVFRGLSMIGAGGAGTTYVQGEGGVSGGDGVRVENDSLDGTSVAQISAAGMVTVEGNDGAGAGVGGIRLRSLNAGTSQIVSTANNVIVGGNSMTLDEGDGGTAITAPAANSVTLKAFTTSVGQAIIIGGADVFGQLGLTDAEIDRVSAGTINIGDANTGPINFAETLNRSSATNLVFTNGGVNAINNTSGMSSGVANSEGGNITYNPGTGGLQPKKAGIDTTSNAGISKLSSGENLTLAINGTTVDTGYDQWNVQGIVDITGSTLNLTCGFTASAGDQFVVVNNDGSMDAVIGTFSNGPILANFCSSGRAASIDYGGGDGNDVVITVAPLAADVSVTKDDGVTQYIAGQTLTYNIVVSNAAGGDQATVNVVDNFPLGAFSSISWTCSGTAGTACAAMGTGDISDNAIIPGGGSVTYVVSATVVANNPPAQISNTVTISSTIDNSPNNNQAIDTDNIAPATIQFAGPVFVGNESMNGIVRLTRTGDTSTSSTVNFTTTNGTAVAGTCGNPGVDYADADGQVTFAIGETTKDVSVFLCGDLLHELTNETIALSITAGTNAVLGTQTTATLEINDTASQYLQSPPHTPITFSSGNQSVPYPSQITVAGAPNVGSMRVTIYDLSVDRPDDVDILLVGPQGQEYVLMADVGGVVAAIPAENPVTLTFSDYDTDTLPDNGPLTTGQFLPTTCETPVSNFPSPAPIGPYVEPGCDVARVAAETMGTTFAGNPNGVWSLYVRDDAGQLRPLDAEGINGGVIAGGWGLEFLAVTASDLSISGRVGTADGRGITNAAITVTGGSLRQPVTAVTGRNGTYNVSGLKAGETYLVTVGSRRFNFTQPSRLITLGDNAVGVDFTAR